MSTHSALRAIAVCAPGKRVRVFLPAGKVFDLPPVALPQLPAAPDPLVVLSQQLLERDAVVAARAELSLSAVRTAVDALAANQAEIVASVKELEGTLHLPVKPIYDRTGKLIAAQRVKPGA